MRSLLIVALLAAPAFAGDPKYEYRPGVPLPVEDEPLKLKANVALGMIYVDGNAFQFGVTASGLFAMRKGQNAAEAFVTGAYGKVGTTSDPTTGRIDGDKVSAKSWLWHLRYDRFFLKKNTAFLMFRMNGDELAGIDYRIEPQVGYARIFYESAKQLFRGEIGYTYTYENYIDPTMPAMPPAPGDAHFHSGRLFLYYENKFTPYAQFSEALELLEAFNELKHFRLMSITSLSSQVSRFVALKVNFTIKFNNDPPERPIPSRIHFETVDTILEAVLAVTII